MSIFTRKKKQAGTAKSAAAASSRSSAKTAPAKGGKAKAAGSTKKSPAAGRDASARKIEKLLKPRRSWKWRLFKWSFIFLLLIALFPVALAAIYKIPGVRPVSMLMLSERLAGQPVNRTWVDFDDIAPVLVQSVMMSEDGQFCSHKGVDWSAVELVIEKAFEGERPRGASTIAMQTAKNLFLWNGRSYLRKAVEVPAAMMSDFVLGKKRLMEIYLNVAEWGPGVYGIEAAAQHHFKRPAAKLTGRQAARLAVILPNPKLRDPNALPRALLRHSRRIEQRAKQSGAYIRCLYRK